MGLYIAPLSILCKNYPNLCPYYIWETGRIFIDSRSTRVTIVAEKEKREQLNFYIVTD